MEYFNNKICLLIQYFQTYSMRNFEGKKAEKRICLSTERHGGVQTLHAQMQKDTDTSAAIGRSKIFLPPSHHSSNRQTNAHTCLGYHILPFSKFWENLGYIIAKVTK